MLVIYDFFQTLYGRFAGAAVSFFLLAIVFVPLERAFPAKKQRFFRPAWWADLCFFLGQYLLWSAAVLFLLAHFADYLDTIIPGSFRNAVASQPWPLQAVEVILLSDLFVYWGHRLQHNVPFLWRFHSVHHSAEHLDWLAAHREHPLDTVYTMGLINLPPFILGFPLHTLAGLIAFRGLWAIYIHSNVRLPIGPLRWFIGAPELHHWHHDKDRFSGNYANISPLMDLLFGTYQCPDHEPASFGLHEPAPSNYLAHLLLPLLPRSLQARFLLPGPVPPPSPSPSVIPEPPTPNLEPEPSTLTPELSSMTPHPSPLHSEL
jgi:sterol desaturase/sphingolipid hydroxylase (fatty acid hydroxylase superfamily)